MSAPLQHLLNAAPDLPPLRDEALALAHQLLQLPLGAALDAAVPQQPLPRQLGQPPASLTSVFRSLQAAGWQGAGLQASVRESPDVTAAVLSRLYGWSGEANGYGLPPGMGRNGASEPTAWDGPGRSVGRPDSGPGCLAFTRCFAVVAILLTAGYLTWRLAAGTVNPDFWWVSVPLIVAEIHNAAGLILFTTQLWDTDLRLPWRRVQATSYRVAVLIPTYNEPEEVLLPTVAAAVRLSPPHDTWVLDDGRRPWVRELATELGARYLARPDNRHAKAGNLNYAL